MKSYLIKLFFSSITLILLIILYSCGIEEKIIPTASLKIDKLVVSISENGSIKAKRSVNVKAPSTLRGNSKILKIVPEGTLVKKGDFVLQLDGEELQKKIESIEEELKSSKADIEKSNANHKFSIKQVNYALENAETNFKLAKMRLKQIEFESESRQQQEKMSFKIAENNYNEIKEKLKLQKVINSTERLRLLSKYRQAELKLEKRNKALTQLTLTAPDDGLVIYSKIWKGNKTGKIQIGDTPWRGQSLIELPDLSEIEVETTVNEVDISKIKKGMKVNIVLDAFREKIYSGEISTISRLAHRDEENYGINVFDVNIKVINVDDQLKPGMSAKCELIIAEFDSILTVPIDAIFRDEKVKSDSLKNFIYLSSNGDKKNLSFEKCRVKIVNTNEIIAGIKFIDKKNIFTKENSLKVSLINLNE